jgi:cell wall-active antibiotic response 4TMS protein YvqF
MRRGYRSLFWPAILILIGVFALLVNVGFVPVERLDRLVDLWPLILVVIGLELVVRRALQGAAAEIAAALIVLLAIGGAAAYVALGPSIPTGIQTLDASDKVGSLNHATARVEVGAAAITMQGSSSIGDDLFRAHIEYSGRKPDVSLDASSGELQISQSNTAGFFLQSRRFNLTLQLNSSVPWKIAVDSGSASDALMLSTVHVEGIDVNTGASKEDITVGAPNGTVPITVNGGALTVNVHRPPGAAASVSVSGGAASLSFDGRESKAVGTLTAQTSDYDHASDRYEIQVDGGACTVNVDTRPVGA